MSCNSQTTAEFLTTFVSEQRDATTVGGRLEATLHNRGTNNYIRIIPCVRAYRLSYNRAMRAAPQRGHTLRFILFQEWSIPSRIS